MNRLARAGKAVMLQFGAAVAPALTRVFNVLATGASIIANFLKNNRGLVVALGVVGAAAGAVGVALTLLGGALMAVGGVIAAIIPIVIAFDTVLFPIWGTIQAIVVAVATGIAIFTAVAGVLVYVAHKAGMLTGAFAWLRGVFGELLGTVKQTFGGILNAIKAGQYVLAAKILWAGLKLAFFQGARAGLQAFEYLWSNASTLAMKFFEQLIKTAWNVFKRLPGVMLAALRGGKNLTDILAETLFSGGGFQISGALDGAIANAQADLQNFNRQAARANAPRGVSAPGAGRTVGGNFAVGGLESRQDQANRHLRNISRRIQAQPRFG
jgi:hypothetical protein